MLKHIVFEVSEIQLQYSSSKIVFSTMQPVPKQDSEGYQEAIQKQRQSKKYLFLQTTSKHPELALENS